jgi:hypothetical protein
MPTESSILLPIIALARSERVALLTAPASEGKS